MFVSSPREFLVSSFSKTESGLCLYHLSVRSNFNRLHSSEWITFPTYSHLLLCSFKPIIILLFWEFFIPALGDSFSLEFEWQQVSKTFLGILTNVNNAVVWIVSAYLLIYKSSRTFINTLGIVPGAPITFGITVTYMFYSVFSSLARFKYSSVFSLSFNFNLWSAGTTCCLFLSFFSFFFFCCCWLSLGLDV